MDFYVPHDGDVDDEELYLDIVYYLEEHLDHSVQRSHLLLKVRL